VRIVISQLNAYIALTRPVNCVITFFVVIVSAIICFSELNSEYIVILAAVSAALTAAAGNIINDIYDVEADKINHPERPIAKGMISIKNAWIAYLLLTVVAILTSVFINRVATVIIVLTSILLYLYSIRIKKIPLLGNVTIAYLTGLAFVYGGVAVGNVNDAFIPAIFAFMITLIRELLKDVEAIEGVKKVGLTTFPLKFGTKITFMFIVLLTIALILVTIYPFLNQIYSIEYFIITMIIVNPILVYFIKLLYKDNEQKNLNKLSNMLKLNMVFGLLAIFVGK